MSPTGLPITFHPRAAAEVNAAARFYDKQATRLGARFLNELEAGAALLSVQPELGQEWADGARRWQLHVFPYTIIYQVEADRLWIYAVAHQRRRPGYWTARLGR